VEIKSNLTVPSASCPARQKNSNCLPQTLVHITRTPVSFFPI